MTRGRALDMPRIYHMAGLVSRTGAVSPLCARSPRRIDLRRAFWTLQREAVTCERCRAVLDNLEEELS